uniref:Uncharacterized protein n=1 Tax=Setaria italica TaxID=4555 RepID=K3YF45_SETIT
MINQNKEKWDKSQNYKGSCCSKDIHYTLFSISSIP